MSRDDQTGARPPAEPGTRHATPRVRLVAFYLPQFHPIPENDAWWGRGFTEWKNVTRAQPVFPGHHQPHLPADLGFYDLRVPEVREQQASLARAYGIHGFCYYYYWFAGRRLLERPLQEMLATGRPDFPFCICWANENWTRRWDGDEHEILIGQDHSPDSDSRFIVDAIPILKDRRYIQFEGKPILVVYRAGNLPEPLRTTEIWRDTCRVYGIPAVHLVAAQSFGLVDPRPLGFDAAVEFPPHGIPGHRINRRVAGVDPRFQGKIYDYRDAVEFGIRRPREDYRLHRGVMVAWDNTPRRGLHAHVWHHAIPEEYQRWLRAVIEASCVESSEEDPLVFINAWNEWAEGAYLEPDQEYGHAYLQATRRALLDGSRGGREFRAPAHLDGLPIDELRRYLHQLEQTLERYQRANAYFRAELEARDAAQGGQVALFSPEPPGWLLAGELCPSGAMRVEEIGPLDAKGHLVVTGGRRMRIVGWAFAEGIDPGSKQTRASLILCSRTDDLTYFAPVGERIQRRELTAADPGAACTVPCSAGFSVTAWYEGVEPGTYEFGIVHGNGSRAAITMSDCLIQVPAAE